MTCQNVFGEQLKSKEKDNSNIFNFINEDYILNEVWNEKIEEKYFEVKKYIIKSKIGNDESEVEEIFKTPVDDKYSRMKFSLEKIERIFDLLKNGLDKCFEIDEDLIFEINNFKYIYYVYNYCYESLDSDYRVES